MASTRNVNRSFAGGEIGPDMFGRIDDQKYQSGAALVRNFITLPQGPAENRSGFEFVNTTKNNGVARLIPFIYSVEQTMVIELGDHYARFHTNAETLQYPALGLGIWRSPSGPISYTVTTPAVFNWPAFGLGNGDPIRFYQLSGDPLPVGLKVGYTYTIDRVDINHFRIRDASGALVGLSPAPGGTVTYTNYPGSGTTSTYLTMPPNQTSNSISGVVGGLASTAVPGGSAVLNASFSASGHYYQGNWTATLQYSTDGSTWRNLSSLTSLTSATVRVSIPVTNLNQIQLRVYVSGQTGPSGTISITATVSSWSVDLPTGGTPPTMASVQAYRYYAAGDFVTYNLNGWVAQKDDSGGLTEPGTDATVWAQFPSDMVYEIATPYAVADLFDIHYVQSEDVLTLVHPNYPPAELRRLGPTKWTLTNILFTPSVSPPPNVAVTPSPGFKVKISTISGTLITTATNHTLGLGDEIYIDSLVANTGGDKSGFYIVSEVPVDTSGNLILNQLRAMDYNGANLDASSWGGWTGFPTIQLATKSYDPHNYYVVTSVAQNGVDESRVSSEVSALNNLDVPGAYNTITWDAVDGTLRYQVYKKRNGLYGYIGETTDTHFVDDNIAPDFSITPPNYEDALFRAPGDYPGAVGYAEQRRAFAGTNNHPQSLWMSNSGTETTFSYSLPVKDTDRIDISIYSREANIIRHIVPLTELILLTSSAEIAVKAANSDVITPTTVSARPQSYVGASNVQPMVVNNALVYCADRGGHVREMGFSWEANGFRTGDLSLRAVHLFDLLTLVDMAYQKAPRPIVWFISSSGDLLGLTYIPEEQIGAWHHHDTQGVFESIACVAEGQEDRLYAVIQRTINGAPVRYIERMASRTLGDQNDAFFVDAGATYKGAPATTVSGLTWLEGETVVALADGAVYTGLVVTGGVIHLAHEAETITVGLPYTSDLVTLPPVLQVDGFGQGRMLNINRVWMRVLMSSGIWVGPDEDHLVLYKQRTTEPYGSPPALVTGQIGPIVTTPDWAQGTLWIRQTDPLPVTVVGLTMELSIGG